MTTQIDANRRVARRLLILVGVTVGVPVLLLFGLVIGLVAGWPVGIIAGLVAGAATGTTTAWRARAAAVDAVLRGVGAAASSPAAHPRFHNLVEGLCVAGGVSKPDLYVVPGEALNSMTAGLSPSRASLVVTTGLLDGLSRIELEGVLAHELSHVRTGDIVPATLAVAVGGLLGAVPWGRAALEAAMSPRRELSADLAGVSLTRYPPGLLTALEKVRAGAAGPAGASVRTAHLWLRPPASQAPAGRPGPALERSPDPGGLELRIETLREL